MNRRFFKIVFILAIFLLANCDSGNKPRKPVSTKNKDAVTPKLNHNITINRQDSTQLTALIRNVYKWHQSHQTEEFGFEPKKKNPSDTLYTSIDFEAVNITIKKLKESGYFDDDFLANYRNI